MRKPVVGFEGVYEVSDTGEVFRVSVPSGRGGSNTWPGRRLTPKPHVKGYVCVKLTSNNITKLVKVHRLVAQAFIPNPNGLLETNHKNCDKRDNRVENLEWCTRRQNVVHAFDNGCHDSSPCARKPVMGVHIKTNECVQYASLNDAKRDGFHPAAISLCALGKHTKHRGYRWSYVNSSASPAPLSAS